MEQSSPRCVRGAWDPAERGQGASTLPASSSEDSGPWPLLFYPELGQLAWDDEVFNQELLCRPCGLLSRYCRRHRARSRSPRGREQSPQPSSQSPTTGEQPEEPGGRARCRPPPQPFPPASPAGSSERCLPPARGATPRLSKAAGTGSRTLWPGSPGPPPPPAWSVRPSPPDFCARIHGRILLEQRCRSDPL